MLTTPSGRASTPRCRLGSSKVVPCPQNVTLPGPSPPPPTGRVENPNQRIESRSCSRNRFQLAFLHSPYNVSTSVGPNAGVLLSRVLLAGHAFCPPSTCPVQRDQVSVLCPDDTAVASFVQRLESTAPASHRIRPRQIRHQCFCL